MVQYLGVLCGTMTVIYVQYTKRLGRIWLYILARHCGGEGSGGRLVSFSGTKPSFQGVDIVNLGNVSDWLNWLLYV